MSTAKHYLVVAPKSEIAKPDYLAHIPEPLRSNLIRQELVVHDAHDAVQAAPLCEDAQKHLSSEKVKFYLLCLERDQLRTQKSPHGGGLL